jgi:hypothetical protein
MEGVMPLERRVHDVLSSFTSAARPGLVHILTLESSEDRARTIGNIWEAQELRPLANLLIDLEAEPSARAFVAGMLLEHGRRNDASASSG